MGVPEKGPIKKSYQLGKSEDRGASVLNAAWLISKPSVTLGTLRYLVRDDPALADPVESVLPRGEQPLLAMLNATDSSAARVVDAVLEQGRRVYLLVSKNWLPSETVLHSPTQAILLRRSLRRMTQLPLEMVFSAEDGWLWLGESMPFVWRLTLERAQLASARRLFLHCFWTLADEQTWPHEKKLSWRAAEPAPFGVSSLSSDGTFKIKDARQWQADWMHGDDVIIYDPSAVFGFGSAAERDSQRRLQRLWSLPDGTRHACLSKLVQADTEVCWRDDLELPPCQVRGTDEGQLHVNQDAEDLPLEISLTPEQAGELAQLLMTPPAAQFKHQISLNQAKAYIGTEGELWLKDEPEPAKLIERELLHAREQQAGSLRAYPDVKPSAYPSANPLALSCHYQWQVRMPTIPHGASVDQMYQAWKSLDQQAVGMVKTIETKLARSAQKLKNLKTRFSRFLGGELLGFKGKHERQTEKFQTWKQHAPSAQEPQQAREQLEALRDLQMELSEDEKSYAKAEQQARTEEARAQQEAEFDERQQKSHERLAIIEAELPKKT